VSIRAPLSGAAPTNYIPTTVKSLQVVQPSNQELKERKEVKRKLRKEVKRKLRKEKKEMKMEVDEERAREVKTTKRKKGKGLV